MDVQTISDLGGLRLIKIRNPWAQLGGLGWSGDWGRTRCVAIVLLICCYRVANVLLMCC